MRSSMTRRPSTYRDSSRCRVAVRRPAKQAGAANNMPTRLPPTLQTLTSGSFDYATRLNGVAVRAEAPAAAPAWKGLQELPVRSRARGHRRL